MDGAGFAMKVKGGAFRQARNGLRRHSRLIALAALFCFASSLALPAGTTENGHTAFGLDLLLLGWLGLGGGQVAWLANPLIVIVAVWRLRGWRQSPYIYLILLACGLSALAWHTLPDDSGSNPLESWGAGYYVWWLAIGLCLISAFEVPLQEPSDAGSD